MTDLTPAPLALDDRLWVYSFGKWYAGRVARVTATRVFVTYTTGTGTTRTKPYNQADRRLARTQPARDQRPRRVVA